MKLTRINSKLSTANKSPLGVWSCERRTERGEDNACSEGSSRRSCNARQLFASVVNLYSRRIGEWAREERGRYTLTRCNVVYRSGGVLPRRALHFCASTAAFLDRHPRHPHYRKTTTLDFVFVSQNFYRPIFSNISSYVVCIKPSNYRS